MAALPVQPKTEKGRRPAENQVSRTSVSWRMSGDAAARAGGLGVPGDDEAVAGVAVPGGDAVTPPQLAGDAPVVDVVHPLVVGALVVVGREADVAFVDGLNGLVGEWLDLEEPLL